MKLLSAILSGLLLAWTQLSAMPTLPACAKQPVHACCHCGGKMSCCAAPTPGSQSAPAVPAAGIQNQFSFMAPAVIAWSLPEKETGTISCAFVLPLTATSAPLYARDCARLI